MKITPLAPTAPALLIIQIPTHAHRAAQLYPQSVGAGRGYSVLVNGPFAQVRRSVEKPLGKPLNGQTGEGMRSCELPLAEKKTAMLVACGSLSNPNSQTTLLGCDQYHEK